MSSACKGPCLLALAAVKLLATSENQHRFAIIARPRVLLVFEGCLAHVRQHHGRRSANYLLLKDEKLPYKPLNAPTLTSRLEHEYIVGLDL